MGLLDNTPLRRLVIPGVTSLVLFLALTSQWLFHYIEPGPLRKGDAYLFNVLVTSLLICYWRTCFTDPGRIPKDWHETISNLDSAAAKDASKAAAQSNRWCRRCEAFKPPRAHHCKTCQRCVMKMDHHCVWTANCVSHITIPHFIRFLFFADMSMAYLEYFLFQRAAVLWRNRHLPSYLGPSVFQLAHLFILLAVNSLVLFALVILLGRTLWSLAVNTWTIEGWEIERHETLLRRAKVLGGFLDGPDGIRIRIDHQEFPWDVGIWSNICQGMGSKNPLSWFWPFSRSPSLQSGLSFEHNEIDDPSKPWPPPDPDRLFRAEPKPLVGDGFTKSWDVDAFKQRQAADMARFKDADGEYVLRRRPFHERLQEASRNKTEQYYEEEDALDTDDESEAEDLRRGRSRTGSDAGEEGWRNNEGERLADFGVDEIADFYDEDDVPLGELLRRSTRNQAATKPTPA